MSSTPVGDYESILKTITSSSSTAALVDWNKLYNQVHQPTPPPLDPNLLRKSVLEWTAFSEHLKENPKLSAYEALQAARFEVLNQNPELYDKKGGI